MGDHGECDDRNNPDTSSESDGVREMIAWFLSEYEDPVESCPYESAEGGYQYIYGGPVVDERVELEERFPHATEKDLDRAAAILQQCDAAGVWSKQSRDSEFCR